MFRFRWHNKEAHDFLDEAKKIMFGMIPPSGELRGTVGLR